MKITIRDVVTLQRVLPADLTGYLRTHGWSQSETGPNATMWTATAADERTEVLCPLDPSFKDYPFRIGEALEALSVVEARSQDAILRDILTTSVDLIRVSAHRDDLVDGTIGIQEGVALVTNTRELVLAAACAAARPRPFYPRRKPPLATSYMEGVRLGQTERGSYVVTVHSPVTPTLQIQTMLPTEDPFERRVVTTLFTALAAVQNAAQASAATGRMDPFLEATGAGVSANLCDAVASLQDSADARSLGFAVSWAPLRALSGPVVSRVSIGTDLVPVIREASRMFKAAEPQEDFELQGLVVRADRPGSSDAGTITVAGVVETELRQVRVRLAEVDYNSAVTAHRDRTPICCVGELQKDGRQYVLLNPRGFGILDVEA